MALTVAVLNSVSISGTTATLNITPPAVEAAYALSQIFYKKKGHSAFTTGSTYVGSLGVAGNATQTGLTADTLYEFMVEVADSASRYSAPSSVLCAQSTATASENNLFVANAITLLSNCTSFISWVGGATASDALLRIHNRELSTKNPNKNIYFPCAVVYYQGDSSNQIDTANFIRNVNIKIQLLSGCESEKDRDEPVIATAFMNTVGKICDELEQLQGVDSYMCFKNLTGDNQPSFDDLTLIDEEQESRQDIIFINLTLQAGH